MTSDWVISRMEAIFEDQVDAMERCEDDGKLAICMRIRPRNSVVPAPFQGEHDAEPASGEASVRMRTIRFPGKSTPEAWKYTVITRILELIHEALISGVAITKRDIYYRQPDLFVTQSVVDRCVDDLAFTFGVPRSLLNVSAAAKGLVLGNFTIVRADGAAMNGLSEKEGVLVPNIVPTDTLNLRSVEFVLVVEKEATFRTLASSNLKDSGILLTAKGYPDIATRSFLRTISTTNSTLPLFALVDFDPDGLAILSTYTHGSASLAHENAALSVPSIQWLGIKSQDVSALEGVHARQGLLKLTKRDRGLAQRMLGNEVFGEGGLEGEWRNELLVMLMLGVKAEIQILEAREGGVVEWVKKRLGLV
ncbi:DNA topoisomerase IV, alpha subunit [Aulographum hederae CBS 113979]|uniref:DNA topoisomerase (ATP-hydrolyzing) n=1 Tax=Aulographum hederae CBS 113979 TaxID=1176131 RepID=A0A6G1HE95_9PEZI|nr:DNA topoisomerase IV, alpha subunit [Aulographum hederae CBS 113979]